MKLITLASAAGSTGLLVLILASAGCSEKQPEEVAADIRGAPMRRATNVSALASAGSVTAQVASVSQPSNSVKEANDGAIVAAENGQYKVVGFDRLSGYEIEVSDEVMAPKTNVINSFLVETQIPASVRALNKKQVSLQGFMLPLKVPPGKGVTEMLIMKDQSMCCYGTVPRINEWVSVKMTGDGVKPVMDQPVTILGTLHVGEMRENGYLVGIYSLDGEKMIGPSD